MLNHNIPLFFSDWFSMFTANWHLFTMNACVSSLYLLVIQGSTLAQAQWPDACFKVVRHCAASLGHYFKFYWPNEPGFNRLTTIDFSVTRHFTEKKYDLNTLVCVCIFIWQNVLATRHIMPVRLMGHLT